MYIHVDCLQRIRSKYMYNGGRSIITNSNDNLAGRLLSEILQAEAEEAAIHKSVKNSGVFLNTPSLADTQLSSCDQDLLNGSCWQ